MVLYYSEASTPYIITPRMGVLHLHCVYNPFPETRNRGVSTTLLKNLIDQARTGLKCMNGVDCSFISAEAFNTGEGTSMESFYMRNGFTRNRSELIYEIHGKYTPRWLVPILV
jgi:GNAT superfamily N-acetyltransferase